MTVAWSWTGRSNKIYFSKYTSTIPAGRDIGYSGYEAPSKVRDGGVIGNSLLAFSLARCMLGGT
jgi:hypothetical protein